MQNMFERRINLNINDAGYGLQIRKGQFVDKAHIARHEYFAEIGWASIEVDGVNISTEAVQDRVTYASQAQMLETLLLTLSLEHLAPDRKSCVLRCDFLHDQGDIVVSISSTLIWLRKDNGQRVPAPMGLVDCLSRLPVLKKIHLD